MVAIHICDSIFLLNYKDSRYFVQDYKWTGDGYLSNRMDPFRGPCFMDSKKMRQIRYSVWHSRTNFASPSRPRQNHRGKVYSALIVFQKYGKKLFIFK